jgi:hypothetical protein
MIVPRPITDIRRGSLTFFQWVELTFKRAQIKQRDKVTPYIALGVDHRSYMKRSVCRLHSATKLYLSNFGYTIFYPLFETNNATGYMPRRTVKLVVPPSEQCLAFFIFYQQVDVDHRRQSAHKVKSFCGQTISWIWNMGECLIQ